jgi:hypothetical protein
MRYGLIDMLIIIASGILGTVLGMALSPFLPGFLHYVVIVLASMVIYFAAVYPIYRTFKLFPMILPRCPCCNQSQNAFLFQHAWPRVIYHCPTCKGEFVVWHDGKPAAAETWDTPVLALKWPYAFGRYKRMQKPEQPAPSAGD